MHAHRHGKVTINSEAQSHTKSPQLATERSSSGQNQNLELGTPGFSLITVVSTKFVPQQQDKTAHDNADWCYG